jgi:hypothetical protein
MGYEPTLIIRKKDLEFNSHLAHALNMQTVKFPEIEVAIIRVELTSTNKRVRTVLDKLKIDYREFNG